jgi:hypothetical protein
MMPKLNSAGNENGSFHQATAWEVAADVISVTVDFKIVSEQGKAGGCCDKN